MEFTTYLQFVVALILVIGLILGLAWIMKRFGLMGSLQGAMGRKRRLAVIESAALDGRNRVVLLRRDNVEHLVLVGPNTSQVIESGVPVPEGAEAPPPQGLTQGLPVFSQFLPRDKEQ
jgi:flagellar protein FliO/FliZ